VCHVETFLYINVYNTCCLKRLLELFEVIFYIFFRNGTFLSSRKRSDTCTSEMDSRGIVQWLKLEVQICALVFLVGNLLFEIVGAAREGTEFLLC